MVVAAVLVLMLVLMRTLREGEQAASRCCGSETKRGCEWTGWVAVLVWAEPPAM